MDLAYLTGQRVGDVWAMDVRQVSARGLVIQQSKTSNRVTLEITGELAALLERIVKRKEEQCPNGREKVYSTRLIVDDDGLALGRAALRYRFDKAREAAGITKGEFQFRDLRAKAGTDKADSAKDIREAQAQLGHSSVTTTEIYVRKRRGAKATPTR
ncbi:tyrosine-type recombinase/integrase [Stenotrophomonas maltophilia]|nr:tyrosine-type recombinase/integrase [Stenotrophomonas maltophilia]MBH1499358.1 tyrosine-type recombinase/integrase [Stenotrophomonas maltophilia]MBH1534770.1 tyrosine-type recombinase/integrase [Stenotrophomonas maltophilia]MBN5000481.1 tyrosine-type recombinase/integrase [Stenotrophomonas maltophilia]MBN5007118.1 tyrosine-type recombinase/integrase [Stenotrophomonas maltophilia]MCU1192396.1 tyrosine-type recombinase/integrase [Stenotrophomonas maltophilia]